MSLSYMLRGNYTMEENIMNVMNVIHIDKEHKVRKKIKILAKVETTKEETNKQ